VLTINHIILSYLIVIIVVLALMTMFVIVYNYFRKQKVNMQNEIVLVKEVHQRTMLSTQLEIQEQTFSHISREIHDHVGQRLTLARFYLSSMSDKDQRTVLTLSDTASQLIGEAITDLKQLSRSLTSSLIEDNGLLFALEQETERISRLVNWKLTLSVNGDSKFISTDSELIIFRIVQEALQNIIKYAKPENVNIDFVFTQTEVALTIVDDGIGFDPSLLNQNTSGKSGLVNMKKRSLLLNGTMNIDSSPGHGTKLSFIFPLNYTYA
jgi:two-component system NarL family sensor kinase